MDLLKAQYDRISRQLSGLTSSQKMLTAALVAIMAMTLIWWGKYAGDPEMVPLLDQPFSPSDMARIEANLDLRQIRYTTTVDRVLVPADRKFEVIAGLTVKHLMPRNTSAGFDEMLSKANNPFNPDSTTKQLWNHGKEMALSEIIGDIPNVEKASVMIDPTHEMHVSGSLVPSATIAITMQDGTTADQDLVDGAADLVQGAISGMDLSQIKVVVDGHRRTVHNTDDMSGGGDEALALQEKAEHEIVKKIGDLFGDIPDLKVSVTVKVSSTSTQVHQTDYDGKKTVSRGTESTNDTTDTATPGNPAGADPGAVPNVVQTPGSGGGGLSAPGGATTSHEEKTSDKTVNFVPNTVTDSKTGAGGVSVVGATVRIPMTYFAGLYLNDHPNAKAPSGADLAPLINAELPQFRKAVLNCAGLTAENDVEVQSYFVAAPVKAAEVQAASALSVGALIGSHGRDLTLGGLAIMSLFMVTMMVRKGSPVLAVPVGAPNTAASSGPAAPMGPLNPDEAIAGEAGGETMLAGMELDEATVRNQQMLEQVSSMVKENPDVAATLVKRWMNRT